MGMENMFHFDEDLEMYSAELDGVEFVCEEPGAEQEQEAKKLAKLYAQKLPEIVAFLLPEIQKVYGEVDREQLPRLLGRPTVNLDTFQVMYMEQTLDDSHIIEFEYADDFEGFECFNIDG